MIRSYLTINLQNLWKNRPTLIKVLGQARGITSCLIIFFIVSFELSYDNFVEKGDRIYRLTSSSEFQGNVHYYNTVPEAFLQDFADDIEEVLALEQSGV